MYTLQSANVDGQFEAECTLQQFRGGMHENILDVLGLLCLCTISGTDANNVDTSTFSESTFAD